MKKKFVLAAIAALSLGMSVASAASLIGDASHFDRLGTRLAYGIGD
jgi:hypothetical protein